MSDYIPVPFPHMVLNSHDVPPPDYEMWNSWKVDASDTAEHMAGICAQIWIIACRVSRSDDNVSGGPSGSAFCKLLAKTTMAEVTAAVRNQPSSGPISIPPWHVDTWVGEVYTYYPGGAVSRRQ